MDENATSIVPWLSVPDGAAALRFYSVAFGAEIVYQLKEVEPDVVARLSIDGAQFWVGSTVVPAQMLRGGAVRLILTVAEPEAMFAQALAAGATEVFPVGEDHGWKLGRLTDPFGLDWEIGHPLAAN